MPVHKMCLLFFLSYLPGPSRRQRNIVVQLEPLPRTNSVDTAKPAFRDVIASKMLLTGKTVVTMTQYQDSVLCPGVPVKKFCLVEFLTGIDFRLPQESKKRVIAVTP